MIVTHGVIDQASETICALDAFVVFEIESWRMPQAEPTTDFTTQEARGTPQTLADFVRRMALAERDKQHAGRPHVWRDLHRRDGHHAYSRIFDLSRYELSHDSLQLGLDALLTGLAGHEINIESRWSSARRSSDRARHLDA